MRVANRMKNFYLALLSVLLLSCNRIETGASLSADEVSFIRGVGLLNPGETIHRFYSNSTFRTAGSFYTDQRMAHYWLEGKDTSQHQREYAFYPEIVAVDPVFHVPDFDCPYLQIRKKDQTSFRMYLEGSPEQMQMFYQEALNAWKRHRHDTR